MSDGPESIGESRYQTLFENAPVGIWDEDFWPLRNSLQAGFPPAPKTFVTSSKPIRILLPKPYSEFASGTSIVLRASFTALAQKKT